MQQVERATIEVLQKTRRQLGDLQPGETDAIIQAGASLEVVLGEIPEEHVEAINAVTLCLHKLQALFEGRFADFERSVKAILAALAASEQALGAPLNPISELMLKQAQSDLQKELDRATGDAFDEETPAAPVAEAPPAPAAAPAAILTLNDAAAALMQADLADRAALARICDALKKISVEIPDAEQRKLVVKAARELNKITAGKAKNEAESLALVGELIDQVNGQQDDEAAPALEAAPAPAAKAPAPAAKAPAPPAPIIPFEDTALAADMLTHAGVAPAPPPAPAPAAPAVEEIQPDTLPFDSDMGLVAEFVIESVEMLEQSEGALLALENDADNIENVNTVFRAFHTIKGSAAYLGLKRLTELAHHAESLLSRIRDREIRCEGAYANLALRSLDMLKEMLAVVEKSSAGSTLELPPGYPDLMALLKSPETTGLAAAAAPEAAKAGDGEKSGEMIIDDDNHMRIGEILVAMEKITKQQLNDVIARKGDKLTGQVLVEEGFVTWEDVTDALLQQNRPEPKKAVAPDSSIRVRTDRLDSLINMIGELVIAQSMLAQDATVVQGIHHELSRKISHAGKIVRELQDLSMTMRMIPLKSTFQKMTRLVRDVAKKCGKQVEFTTVGEDTEIDRNMVDIIADPLVHMIRNAVDHGIETPSARNSAGKSSIGKVRLSAYHAGGDVVVELEDDGAGLDREKLVAKAISKGLIETDKGMSDGEVYKLIFAPGFSTAEQITDVSGRGVGMDVVRRNIEAMHGRIEISSEKGKGSVFTIRLPLTLAITDGMLVRVGTERYIVPTINIQLSFQPNNSMLSTVTERGELVSLRGELMPIFRLHQLFDVQGAVENPTEGLLMIVADGRRRCALLVDELLGQQQVVTKTLGQGIGKIAGVSGGAILGDGCVGLILDTAEIVSLARRASSSADRREEPVRQAA